MNIVSKKISVKATIRNKVKRRIRASILGLLPQVVVGADVVIVSLKGIERQEFLAIKTTIADLFKKTKII